MARHDSGGSIRWRMVLAWVASLAVAALLGSVLTGGDSGTPECQEGDSADCIAVANAPSTTVATELAEQPLWAEEFDRLDPNRWRVEHSTFGDGNNELQCYTPDQVSVRDGVLVLTAENRQTTCPSGDTRNQTSGMVRSTGWTLAPGQAIEWRARLTPADFENQEGLWPGLWSSSWAEGGWPTGGEWDGFEVMTAKAINRVTFSIHYSDQAGDHAKQTKEVFGEPFAGAWHDFRFEYGLDGVLVWYMDGEETHRVTEAETLQGYPAPFDQTMTELKINLSLGGNPGPLNPLALPATLEIDYVRVWALDS